MPGSMNGLGIFPSGTTYTYAWSVSSGASIFKTYNPDISPPANDQLAALASADYQNSTFDFYASAPGTFTVSCIVTPTLPSGYGSIAAFTLTQQVVVLQPVATWTIPSDAGDSGLHVEAGTITATTLWYPVSLTVPSPFSGGQFCFVQIADADSTVTRTPIDGQPGTLQYEIMYNGAMQPVSSALDQGFPYPTSITVTSPGTLDDSTPGPSPPWGAGTYIAASGDSPSLPLTPVLPTGDTGGSNWLSDNLDASFTTFLMYEPPNVDGYPTAWVPLQYAIWSINATSTYIGGIWSAPTLTGSGWTPPSESSTTYFPQWDMVSAGTQELVDL